MRKKRGSSLLLVLGITFILITVGGIVTTSVMYTTGQHNNVKVESDLTYAAESGIESAYSRIKSGTITLKNGDPKEEYEINNIFNSENIDVKIEVSRNDDKYFVESEATKGNKNSKVKSILNINKSFIQGSNKVFKYVICTRSADIECSGPLDGSVSLWNVKNVNESSFIQNTNSTPSNVNVSIAEEDFIEPNFNFESTGSFKIKNISELDSKNGVRKIKYKKHLGNGHLESDECKEFTIYLVNLEKKNDKLTIETSGLTIDSTILITNGAVRIGNVDYNMTSAPTVTLNQSTILSDRMEMRVSSFTSYYRLIDNSGIGVGHDALNQGNVNEINNLINGLIGNWNGNTGSSGEDIVIGDVEYIE